MGVCSLGGARSCPQWLCRLASLDLWAAVSMPARGRGHAGLRDGCSPLGSASGCCSWLPSVPGTFVMVCIALWVFSFVRCSALAYGRLLCSSAASVLVVVLVLCFLLLAWCCLLLLALCALRAAWLLPSPPVIHTHVERS
jgi:hypothetical protein